MNTKQLQESIDLNRQVLAELERGPLDEKWDAIRQIAKSLVRMARAEDQHGKWRRKYQDADPNSGERDPEPSALDKQLFKELISVDLAIFRRRKQMREVV